jgi:hypothetical protein
VLLGPVTTDVVLVGLPVVLEVVLIVDLVGVGVGVGVGTGLLVVLGGSGLLLVAGGSGLLLVLGGSGLLLVAGGSAVLLDLGGSGFFVVVVILLVVGSGTADVGRLMLSVQRPLMQVMMYVWRGSRFAGACSNVSDRKLGRGVSTYGKNC